MRGSEPSVDPAERQADEIGNRIGKDLGPLGIGPGPLPEAARLVAEKHLGVDLSGTELRGDGAAHERASSLDALAVAEGSRVSFARGELSTASSDGRSLLGHELTHVAQQRASGMTAEQRQTAGAGATKSASPNPVPPPFKKTEVSFGFDIPGGRVLATVDDVKVETRFKTSVFLSLDKKHLRLSFTNPLNVNIPIFPDVLINSATWDVKSGATEVSTDGVLGFKVEPPMKEFMRDLVTGTPLGIRPYKFEADPDPFGTLQEVAKNLGGGGGGSGGGVALSEVTGIRAGTVLTFGKTIEKSTPAGGIRISDDARLTVTFSGSAATIEDPKQSKITSVELFSGSLFMTMDGKNVAQVFKITVGKGGKVTVGHVNALVAEAALESKLRELFFLGSESTESKFVNELARQKIERALQPAIIEALGENCDLVPGRNLCDDLGIPKKSGSSKP
jgi:hypothetical protein